MEDASSIEDPVRGVKERRDGRARERRGRRLRIRKRERAELRVNGGEPRGSRKEGVTKETG